MMVVTTKYTKHIFVDNYIHPQYVTESIIGEIHIPIKIRKYIYTHTHTQPPLHSV